MKPRLLIAVIALASLLVVAQEKPPAAPPLNEQQMARVRALVQTSQTQISRLQTRLSERQRDLARLYAQYELDDEATRKIQAEIIELQRQLLASHHQMQVELRTIVGKERFDQLRRRLENTAATGALNGSAKPDVRKNRMTNDET